MWVPLVGVAGLLALGAQLNPWTAMGLVMIGAVVGAASVVGLRAVRRRPRRGAIPIHRLGSLDSLAVEHPPSRAEPSQPPDRRESDSVDDEIGFSERVAAILDYDEPLSTGGSSDPGVDDGDEPVDSSRPLVASIGPTGKSADSERRAVTTGRAAGAPRPVAYGVHHPIAGSLTPVGSPATVESSPAPAEPTDESVLSDLTSDEVAALFNRYEHLVRDERDALTEDDRHIDEEIWLDPTQGDAMPYIDTTRRTAEGIWVYLRSGHVICKLHGSDVWTCATDYKRESTKPNVVVSLVAAQEPTELYFSIVADPDLEHSRGSEPIPTQLQPSSGRRSP